MLHVYHDVPFYPSRKGFRIHPNLTVDLNKINNIHSLPSNTNYYSITIIMSINSSMSAMEMLKQARKTVQSDPVHERQMRYANAPIPASISSEVVELCGREKIVKQSPYFECPKWAGLPNSSEWHLEVTKAGFDGKFPTMPISRYPYFILGKNEGVCDFKVEHPSTSGVHCALVFHEERGCFFIVDLNSTNGVYVNGVRIERKQPVELRPPTPEAPKGSEFVLGTSTRTYHLRSVMKSSQRGGGSAAVPKPAAVSAALAAATDLPGAVIAPSDGAQLLGEKRPRDDTTIPLTATAPEPKAEEVISRRFRHILIKHADVAKPVSKARRNKEEPVTRTKEDAVALAASVRDQFLLSSAAPLDATPQERYERRTQKFLEFCAAFSECGSEKKGGDLGMNSEGDFREYMNSVEFDKAAFSLAPCTVSRPIETTLGLHLIFRCQPSEEVHEEGEEEK
jgi:pSer/pThr/pTyr-binding forkhead associated (FHA) protein